MRFAIASLALITIAAGCANSVDPQKPEGPLAKSFRLASAESGVPVEVLLAVGFVESRWQMHEAIVDDEHARAAAGMMGIVDRSDEPRLERAARRLGIDPQDARSDAELNVKVAAEALRALAADEDGRVPKVIAGWRDALAKYGADDDEAGAHYADEVFRVIDVGAEGDASTGEHMVLAGRGKASAQRTKSQALTADSGLAVQFLEARFDHQHAGRSHAIDRVVIHTTEGSYDGTIGWFRSAANTFQTSAHYVIRSSDGEITQMVRERDTAYHVLNWNERAIGIEHEAISSQPQWFTEAMYQSSAALVRDICNRWGIPMDRTHIVGHVEVPGNDHTDPGHIWDWDHFMALVTSGVDDNPPPASGGDACNGLTYTGSCDGTVLNWCENGGLRSVDCAGTAQPQCGWQDDTVGNNCVAETAPPPPPATEPPPSAPPPSTEPADACNGLDYAGACDGSVLNWCENGAPRSVDCATTAQSACGWQDDGVGNNCIAPPPPPPAADPCAGLDYAGTCDGAVLSWCEDGAPQSFDCATTGQSCGWQNDSVGNNCL